MSRSRLVGLGILLGLASFANAQTSPPVAAPATSAGPAAASANNVRIETASPGLRVQIEQTIALSQVISTLCREQQLKCAGADKLASFQVPPMQVEGTLRQVLGKLLEGTEINYSVSRTAPGTAVGVTFLGTAPRGVAVAPTPDNSAAQANMPGVPMHSMRYDPKVAEANRAAQQAMGISQPYVPPNGNDLQRTQQAVQDVLGGSAGVTSSPVELGPVPVIPSGGPTTAEPNQKPAPAPAPAAAKNSPAVNSNNAKQ